MSAQTSADPLKDVAERYVKLVLAMGLHDADYVDAYYGPPEWRKQVEAEKPSLAEIASRAAGLVADVAKSPAAPPAKTDAELWRLRRQYLERQLLALSARVSMLQGKKLSFDEESRALYDAVAPRQSEKDFEAVLAKLEARLPGDGPLIERYEKFKQPFIIPRERLDQVFQSAIRACRDRTRQYVELPPTETFTVEYVTGKSWSGYNWYQGNYKSLIQVNTDLPIYIDRAIDLACHEGYPGHHVYNALLEKSLVRDRGWVEFTVYPLFSPQSLIAEGTANYGIEVAFTPEDRLAFEKDVLFPLAKLDATRVKEYYDVFELIDQLSYAGNEAARRYLDGQIDRPAAVDVARTLRHDAAAARGAAREVLRAVPQLRHQLQPREGPGEGVHRAPHARRCRPRAQVARVHGAAVVTAAAKRTEMIASLVPASRWLVNRGRMRAIEISSFGPPDVLRIAERPTPMPGPGEVLIKVVAAGVNRPDILQRLGKYPPPVGASDIPGLEIAGHIAARGQGVVQWQEGDAVCALVWGGGYAEYCVAPQSQCLRPPATLSLVEAAAVPETFFTVWTNVFERGRLQRTETILIHGGSSGIGTTAIQLARAFGAQVFTTVGSERKGDACMALGAHLALNYRSTDWVQVLKDATAGRGVDVILDMVGGDYVPRNLELLAIEGRLVQIAFLKTSKVELDLMQVMRRRLTITGSTLRPRSPEEKGQIARALEDKVWPLIEAGSVKPIIYAEFPLERAAEAHALMESGEHIGKIVLVT